MEIERIEEELLKTKPVLPAQTRSRVLNRVEEATAEQRVLPAQARAWWKPQASFALRCAGMMAVLALIYMGLTMTSPGHSTLAFAQVEQAMSQIKTAHWVKTQTATRPDGSKVYEIVSDVWVRTNPLVKAVRSLRRDSSPARNEPLQDFREVIDRRGTVMYDATAQECVIVPDLAPPEVVRVMTVERILRGMVLGDLLSPADTSPSSINRKGSRKEGSITLQNWTSERITLKGQPLIKFYREGSFGGKNGAKFTSTIWADPQTKRVVRSEYRTRDYGVDRLTVNDQYRYDEEPPAGTFELKPPPGVKVRIERSYGESPQKPPATELQKAQKLIDGSEAAFRQGNFKTFAALWGFNFVEHLGSGRVVLGIGRDDAWRRGDWKKRIEVGKGSISRLQSRIDPASPRLLLSPRSRSTRKGEPDILMVEVISSGAGAVDGSTWKDRRVPYFFRRVNGELRIVNWKLLQMWDGSSSGPVGNLDAGMEADDHPEHHGG